jgi:hypothetical protein
MLFASSTTNRLVTAPYKPYKAVVYPPQTVSLIRAVHHTLHIQTPLEKVLERTKPLLSLHRWTVFYPVDCLTTNQHTLVYIFTSSPVVNQLLGAGTRRLNTVSQEPATGTYPEPIESTLRPPGSVLKIHSDPILPSTPRSSVWSLSFGLCHENLLHFLSPLPHVVHNPRIFNFHN